MFRHSNLFAPPKCFTRRLAELKSNGLSASQALLLLQVELGFALMEYLHLDDEPVVSVWAILSGMPIRHPRLQQLTDNQRRAIANARQLIPYAARFAWRGALTDYLEIDVSWRNYKLVLQYSDELDDQLDRLNDQIIAASKKTDHKANQAVYDYCLTCQLEFNLRECGPVEANVAYKFEAKTEKEILPISVSFAESHINTATQKKLEADWHKQVQCDKSPLAVQFENLKADAIYLDEREQELAQRFGWQQTDKSHWAGRFQKIRCKKTGADGSLSDRHAKVIEINGFTHLAGMVAAGKTTLSILLATHLIRQNANRRLTIVVGDVQSAIRLANQLNWWFLDDPEQESPVAVPLLGRSKRDAHLSAFYASNDYQVHAARGQNHWGDRWLGTACPLQALLEPTTIRDQLEGRPLIPGTEPCHSLEEKPPPKDSKSQAKNQAKNLNSSKRSSKHLCPFFAQCPSQQVYRDMPSAPIWITTAGGMAMGAVPRHLELRRLKLGEWVYEYSSVVIFDEVDTIVQWFDNVYAETVTLNNGQDGVFDTINIQTEQYTTRNRVRPPKTQRWTTSQRQAQTAITATLTLLDRSFGHDFLRDWTKHGYVTPNLLFYKLARRIAGLDEFDSVETSEAQREKNQDAVRDIMEAFRGLLRRSDPLRDLLASEPKTNSVDGLIRLLKNINMKGESATSAQIHNECRGWINRFFPETEQTLKQLKHEVSQQFQSSTQKRAKLTKKQQDAEAKVDTLDTLAYRLQFCLTVRLLDLHIRNVLHQWQHRPYEMEEQSPHRRMPAGMLNILPLPLTGQQFGYFARYGDDMEQGQDHSLLMFSYTNIGRWYVLNFHRLLTDLNGQPGPHVLALSGTSYLPDSTQFHVGSHITLPYGVLMPEESAQDAIAESHFEFLPQYDQREKPIRFSGRKETEKLKWLREMVKSLTGNGGRGHLGETLTKLRELGHTEPDRWGDRDRILLLVNSYEQSQWAAQTIRKHWPNNAASIYHLMPSTNSDEPNNIPQYPLENPGVLLRDDIETFGQTQGNILVAPMNAIGRGFNILNRQGKAAFGAVYFLTRPYPHPHDAQRLAQELNRRALDWYDNPDFSAWKADGIQKRAEALRQKATQYWQKAEYRSYYNTLRPDPLLQSNPRRDLAATTAGILIQAVGRLIRGGVPFSAYFVDAAWAPKYAHDQRPETSLLAAILDVLEDYVFDDPIGKALYEPLADAIAAIENFERQPNT